MKQQKLIILIGLPYSGKTEYADAWCSQKVNRVRISWSDIMRTLRAGLYDDGMTLAVDASLRMMRQALRKGKDVILDECNLYGPQFGLYMSFAQQLKAKVEFHSIKTSAEECKKKCLAQGGDTSELAYIDRLDEVYRAWIDKY